MILPTKKRLTDKECQEMMKKFGGKRKKLKTFCEQPCYLLSRSETEHLLCIPSNVTELNEPYVDEWTDRDLRTQIEGLKGSLKVIGGSGLTSCYEMFCECRLLEEIDLSEFDTSNVETMECMFSGCVSLRVLNLTDLDTSKVKNMRRMFCNCVSLKGLDLRSFDTSNVENMYQMFFRCDSLEMEIHKVENENLTKAFEKCFSDREIINMKAEDLLKS